MTHSAKVSEARRLRTHAEMLAGVGLFDSHAWLTRKYARHQKILRHRGLDDKSIFQKRMDDAYKKWEALPWYHKKWLIWRNWFKRKVGI